MTSAACIPLSLLLTVLVAAGCGEQQDLVGVPDPPQLSVQAASAPISFPIPPDQFEAVNPCTGLDHWVTITGTAWVNDHGDQWVVRVKRTITTSDGFEGRGTSTEVVVWDNVWKGSINDMLRHPSGARIRAHFVWLADFKTVPPTWRVDLGSLTCVRA